MKLAGRPLAQFLVSTVLVLVGVTATTMLSVSALARAQAEDEARDAARYFANTVVSPLRIADLHGSATTTRSVLAQSVGGLLADGDVYRVKIWQVEADAAGAAVTARIVYSDLPDIEGLRVPVSANLRRALTTGQAVVIAVPPDAAHASEQREGVDTVEVYQAYQDAGGETAVAELYLVTGIQARVRDLFARTVPITVGGPAVLAVLLFPLALRLARKHAASEARRRLLVERLLIASEAERRRLAQLLHDGPVQELAVLSMALEHQAQAKPADRGGAAARGSDAAMRGANAAMRGSDVAMRGADAAMRGSDVAVRVREQVARLRVLLDELDPAPDPETDLRGFFVGLAESFDTPGPAVTVSGSGWDDVGGPARNLLRRCGGELLRNALQHSGATRVQVELGRVRDHVQLTVRDDGTGFDPARIPAGHHGLTLIRWAMEDGGGSTSLTSGSRGTTAVLRTPDPASRTRRTRPHPAVVTGKLSTPCASPTGE